MELRRALELVSELKQVVDVWKHIKGMDASTNGLI